MGCGATMHAQTRGMLLVLAGVLVVSIVAHLLLHVTAANQGADTQSVGALEGIWSKEEGLTHQPLVSILASTTPSRKDFFKNLLESFRRQTYPNKELLVFEDSEGPPSAFWTKIGDLRVRHFHETRAEADVMGIGDKHARMMGLARGDFMAFFDDDNFYGPEYIDFMLTNLRQRNVSLVKLGCWPSFFARWHLQGTPPSTERMLLGNFFLFDMASSDRWDQQYGYAFSYVFSRQAAEANASCPAGSRDMNWDWMWVQSLQSKGLKIAVLTELPPFLVIKIQHNDNISAGLYIGGQALLLRILEWNASTIEHVVALLRQTLPATQLLPHSMCNLTMGVDTDHSKFDLDHLPVSGASECCSACARHPKCQSFLAEPFSKNPLTAGSPAEASIYHCWMNFTRKSSPERQQRLIQMPSEEETSSAEKSDMRILRPFPAETVQVGSVAAVKRSGVAATVIFEGETHPIQAFLNTVGASSSDGSRPEMTRGRNPFWMGGQVSQSKPFWANHVEAIMGSDVEITWKKDRGRKKSRKNKQDGKTWQKRVGLTNAHRRALANLLFDGVAEALIVFEDDARFSKQHLRWIRQRSNLRNVIVNPADVARLAIRQLVELDLPALTKFDPDWDVVQLGHCWCLNEGVDVFAPENEVPDVPGLYPVWVRKSVLRGGRDSFISAVCAHAVVISSKGAARILRLSSGWRALDEDYVSLAWTRALSMYIYRLPIFVQPWQQEDDIDASCRENEVSPDDSSGIDFKDYTAQSWKDMIETESEGFNRTQPHQSNRRRLQRRQVVKSGLLKVGSAAAVKRSGVAATVIFDSDTNPIQSFLNTVGPSSSDDKSGPNDHPATLLKGSSFSARGQIKMTPGQNPFWMGGQVSQSKPFWANHVEAIMGSSVVEVKEKYRWPGGENNEQDGKTWQKRVGLTNAHRRALANLLFDGVAEALIVFEDDARFSKQHLRWIRQRSNLRNVSVNPADVARLAIRQLVELDLPALTKFDPDWDVVQLGHCWCLNEGVDVFAPENEVPDVPGLYPVWVKKSVLPGGRDSFISAVCAHAVVISAKGAARILSLSSGWRALDEDYVSLAWTRALSMYIYRLPIFVQPWQQEGDIEHQSKSDDRHFHKCRDNEVPPEEFPGIDFKDYTAQSWEDIITTESEAGKRT